MITQGSEENYIAPLFVVSALLRNSDCDSHGI